MPEFQRRRYDQALETPLRWLPIVASSTEQKGRSAAAGTFLDRFNRFSTVSGRFALFSHRFFPFFSVVAPQRDRGAVTAPLLRRRSAAAGDF